MGYSLIATVNGTNTGSGTTLDCSGTLNLQDGDLLVALANWYGSTTTVAIDTTDTDNQMVAEELGASGSERLGYGYLLSASANAAATFRMTLGAAQTYRAIVVYQFRPSATAYLVAPPAVATGSGITATSDSISPEGTDILVIGLGRSGTGSIADHEIGGDVEDGEQTVGTYNTIFYKAFATDQTDIYATFSQGSGGYAAAIMAFSDVNITISADCDELISPVLGEATGTAKVQHFEDFSGYVNGVSPTNWTAKWDMTRSYLLTEAQAGTIGGQICRVVREDEESDTLSGFQLGSDLTALVKTEARCRVYSTRGGWDDPLLVICGNGDEGAEEGYILKLIGSQLAVVRMDAGVETELATAAVPVAITGTAWFRVRFEVDESSSVNARIWIDGVAEPATWDIQYDDSASPLAAGWFGIVNYSNSFDCDVLSVGVGGLSPIEIQFAAGTMSGYLPAAMTVTTADLDEAMGWLPVPTCTARWGVNCSLNERLPNVWGECSIQEGARADDLIIPPVIGSATALSGAVCAMDATLPVAYGEARTGLRCGNNLLLPVPSVEITIRIPFQMTMNKPLPMLLVSATASSSLDISLNGLLPVPRISATASRVSSLSVNSLLPALVFSGDILCGAVGSVSGTLPDLLAEASAYEIGGFSIDGLLPTLLMAAHGSGEDVGPGGSSIHDFSRFTDYVLQFSRW